MTPANPVQDRMVTLNGLRFHYREWGDSAAQPLLVLHGFTDHARSWDTFARSMQDHFRVLVPDQRGHGESEWANDYAWERWIEDIGAFIRALELQLVILLGHSMGGANAYRYAGLHPWLADRLIIVDEGPGGEFTPEFKQKLAKYIPSDIFDDPENAIHARQYVFPRANVDELRNFVLNNLIRRDDGRWTYRYDARLRGPNAASRRPEDAVSWALLSKITCPTLIVKAAEGESFNMRAITEQMQRTIPDARLVELPNSGHAVPWENPHGLSVLVRAFLSEPLTI